jgi:hypothetical protein
MDRVGVPELLVILMLSAFWLIPVAVIVHHSMVQSHANGKVDRVCWSRFIAA